ncbi:diacylglycerol O-acyltransferase [Capronia coronata CBS 617.96]|uniref:O-acyltransferase n=1 Tax=Capronia coronata CBS 617.96 TaxID=1182541 RepID=W9YS82_9EURO|nr:diacylglycerol O-acyltransferase [Capronia coronata CBS 617.96]EXJ95373.1 diacylglycerol O-acyltransferase [Capronia coronata CBS 617.96]
MSSNVHTVLSEAHNVTNKGLGDVRGPVEVPGGSAGNDQSGPRIRSKYRHVAALHSKVQPSCLSHEASETPSFIGFRNLMVLTIIVMNLRLVVENAQKYGLLITLKFNIRSQDINTALILYALTPCHLFVAYIIERVAMENAKGAVGRRKKDDPDGSKPETEKEKSDFYYTWWWIAFAHTLNASLALLISSYVVYYHVYNPGLGMISELHAIVVWLKTCSYAFTNRDLRHAMLHPGGPESALPEIYSKCPYPRNVTLRNLCYFWWAPTLVYQPYYPRTDRIRWTFFFKRVGEVLALCVFIWLICAQYAIPVLHNSLDGMAVLDFSSIAERLMKLSTISLIVWLAGFFALFQSFLNALAEIMMFGDRGFYEDWWNSTSLKMYWATWNKPVYHFMRRHIYSPLVGRGWPPQVASALVFAFSGLLHELAVGVPCHSILGVAFLGMVLQLPLIQFTESLTRKDGTGKVIGNCIFWINFVFVGQPLAVMIYFFSWQAKFGSLAT